MVGESIIRCPVCGKEESFQLTEKRCANSTDRERLSKSCWVVRLQNTSVPVGDLTYVLQYKCKILCDFLKRISV